MKEACSVLLFGVYVDVKSVIQCSAVQCSLSLSLSSLTVLKHMNP